MSIAAQPLAPAPALADGVAAFQARAYDRALAIFQPLAEAGDPEAQAWLGALHAGGTGVPASLLTAFEWYRRAAEQGHGPAATNVGAMLAMGQGVAQDRAEGARWLERAAASGDVMAAYNLATLLAKGDGLPADPARAAYLYRSAAEAGHYPSQARLGYLYAHGIGVARDRVEAFAWLSLAAGHGIGTALNGLEEVIKEMSADEKREGATRAQARRTAPGRIAPIPA